jgi:hypothetical protein
MIPIGDRPGLFIAALEFLRDQTHALWSPLFSLSVAQPLRVFSTLCEKANFQ